MEFHHPSSRCLKEAWKPITLTGGATRKLGRRSPKSKGHYEACGASLWGADASMQLNCTSDAKVWKSINLNGGCTTKGGSCSAQQIGTSHSVELRQPNQMWAVIPSGCINATTSKRGMTQFERARCSVQVNHPDARGKGKALEGITPTQGRGSLWTQLKGGRRSVKVLRPLSQGQAKVWESIPPSPEDTPKLGRPSP